MAAGSLVGFGVQQTDTPANSDTLECMLEHLHQLEQQLATDSPVNGSYTNSN